MLAGLHPSEHATKHEHKTGLYDALDITGTSYVHWVYVVCPLEEGCECFKNLWGMYATN